MKVSFPAMRGTIGQREYYTCMMKLSVVPKMFTFRDWAEFSPEEREQRVLNEKRIPGIAKYMLENEDGYLFASITASYKCPVEFTPQGNENLGLLEMDFQEAEFVINDGQHRCAAIAHAVKANPALGEDVLSVLLFPYENRDRMQQMFSDLNRFVAKTSKSLDILYDRRDPLSRLTLDVIKSIDVFDGMVDREAISIGVRSPKLFALSAMYEANKELLKHHDISGEGDDTEGDSYNELVAIATSFWKVVASHMPSWRSVKEQHLRAMELRQESLSSHSTILRALGSTGADLLKNEPDSWEHNLSKLEDIDWHKSNPDWNGICVIAGSVSSNRQSRQATRAYIKNKLDLALTEAEKRSLTPPAEQIKA